MKKELMHNNNAYVVTRSEWTGKFTLTVNGAPTQKVGKYDFQLTINDGTNLNFTIIPNGSRGPIMLMTPEGESIEVVPKLTGAQYAVTFIPVIYVAISTFLCGILGAVVGFAISAACMFFCQALMRSGMNRGTKGILIALTLFVGLVLVAVYCVIHIFLLVATGLI